MPSPAGSTGSFERSFNPDDFHGQRMYMVNKGVAIKGNTLFWTTGWDDHLLAIDARTGRVKWEVAVADWRKGYVLNVPPLVVKNEVIVGPATDDRGANCFLAAYDIHTGKEIWKFYTAPNSADDPAAKTWAGDTWKHGGSPDLERAVPTILRPTWCSMAPAIRILSRMAIERTPGSKFDNLYSELRHCARCRHGED